MNSPANFINQITVAICSYNSAHHLPILLDKLANQESSLPFEILLVDNNSTDNTADVVKQFSETSNIPIRYVLETEQGIPFARNRAIEECKNSRYFAFIDADEIPEDRWLQTAIDVLSDDSIDCVGGKITIYLPNRPAWLTDNLLPFYAEVNHSDKAFKIVDVSTPIWTSNIAYNNRIFQQGLRFDTRYNRKGKGIGGGSDGIMFHYFVKHNYSLIYEPKMEILHLIPDERVRRRYFLKLHYIDGKKFGLYEAKPEGQKLFGIPRFMYLQLVKKIIHVANIAIIKRQPYMRDAMTVAYQIGLMKGIQLAGKES